MSMLIIAGLFALALLAILGVVLTVASERKALARTQEAKVAAAQTAMQQAVAPSASNPVNVSTTPESATQSAEPTLSEQVYALYQQTQNLESRLSTLISLAERFEYTTSYKILDEEIPLTPLPVE